MHMLERMNAHLSIRKYTKYDINLDPEIIHQILEAGIRALSSDNMQS